MRYSFIIATLGRDVELKILLKSIEAQAVNDYEVLVVDQNEHDRVRLLCNNFQCIRYIYSKDKGLSLARNIGIKQASGEYLVFTDDDAELAPDFLENANRVIKQFPEMSVLSGIVLTHGKGNPFSRYMDDNSEEISYHNFDKLLTVFIMHKDFFKTVEGFDEEMGVGAHWGGSEESELLLRGFEAGLKAYYSKTIIAYHPEADFSQMSWRQAFQKGYSYGLGRGAMFKKLIRSTKGWWMFRQWIFSLVKSCAGMAVACISGHWKDSIRHYGAFWGRIVGFALAKTTRF
ncbi:MAG: glycosyltransferase family 2 protein [Candidatus Scalindua sp.]